MEVKLCIMHENIRHDKTFVVVEQVNDLFPQRINLVSK